MTTTPRDPFAPPAFGARPNFAAYYPDTRFIELFPRSKYFAQLSGASPPDSSTDLIHATMSVIQHERIHWQVSHCLSWGMMRSALRSMKTSLSSLFFRAQSIEQLTACLARWKQGTSPIQRQPDHDLVVDPTWSAFEYSVAEHAWLLSILGFLFNHNDDRLSKLRPPDYMLGVACQHLAGQFDCRAVLEAPDDLFKQRVKTFKRTQDDFAVVTASTLPSPLSIEECLAVISQLNYLQDLAQHTAPISDLQTRFVADLRQSLFDGHNETYAHCFRLAAEFHRTEIDALDISTLALICELALDPPLPFEADGSCSHWDWQDFHPSYRFHRLLQTSATAKRSARQPGTPPTDEYAHFLLTEASLARSQDEVVLPWLASCHEDTTQWPSEEINYEHLQWSRVGREALSKNPDLLIKPANTSSSEFEILPYVVVDGSADLAEEATEEEVRQYAEHAFNGYIVRATDALAFGSPRINRGGLPHRRSDVYENYLDGVGEFFSAAFNCQCPGFTGQ